MTPGARAGVATRVLGARVKRLEDPTFLTGQARYLDDIRLPGLLHAAFVRSSMPHARLRSVDVDAARAVDGVVAVFTAADLPGIVDPIDYPVAPGFVGPASYPALADRKVRVPEQKTKRGPRYTPVSRRQDRPNAILWLIRNHPELKDSQIMRLVGTTKSTIQQIRERTHWNSANLTPMDPVTLGLCSQIDLDLEVERAAKSRPFQTAEEAGATLEPARETERVHAEPEEKEIDADAVFAKLKSLSGNRQEDEEEDRY